ncbi:OmpA family protein [Bacteroidales bacterium]|nr:OmpA family protein [Bacteroidales bacterium]
MKKTILVLFLFFAMLKLWAQENPKIKRSELCVRKRGYKEALAHLKVAEKAYKKGARYFLNARNEYLKVAKYNPYNAELNYKIGVCYLFSDNKYEAIEYFKNAYSTKSTVSKDIHLMLAKAYHLTHDFEKASINYTKALSRMEDIDRTQVRKYIKECNHGKMFLQEPQRVIINNLGVQVNSRYDDYVPVVDDNERRMYFNSRRPVGSKSERSLVDDKYFEDIYLSSNIDDQWLRSTRAFTYAVKDKKNTMNNAVVASSKNGKIIYFYNGSKGGGDIITLEKNKKGKYKIEKSLKKINSKYRETSITFSDDGKTAYFVSTNPKNNIGGKDIFVTHKDEKGKWQKPKNLSSFVNTKYDEEGVFVTSDSVTTLYFSSKGHNTMGGFDVFKTYKENTGTWSIPENLGFPVNSADDDIFYRPLKGGKKAYYSTTRESGVGMKDIYKIVYLGEDKELMMEEDIVPLAGLIPPKPSIFFTVSATKVYDNSMYLRGVVHDKDDLEKLLIAKIEIIDLDINSVVVTSMTNEFGEFQVKLPNKKNYGIEVSAGDYLLYLDVLDIRNNPSDILVEGRFGLEKVEIGRSIVLENIFFETGKAALKVESYASLNDVVKLLQQNRKLRIEVAGHTDNVGSLKTNQKLSESRAKSVVVYLTEQGIQKDRLTYVGKGESMPIAPNDTAEGRAQNRRVEFKILSK